MAKKKSVEKTGLKGAAAPMHQVSAPKPDDKWQIEDDARTLVRAEEIRKESKRYDKALAHLQGQKEVITSVEQLKKKYQEISKKAQGVG